MIALLPAPNALLNTEQAATFLNLSPTTLTTWRVRRSDGPPYVRIGRAVRYRLDDLQSWLDTQTHRSTAEY